MLNLTVPPQNNSIIVPFSSLRRFSSLRSLQCGKCLGWRLLRLEKNGFWKFFEKMTTKKWKNLSLAKRKHLVVKKFIQY